MLPVRTLKHKLIFWLPTEIVLLAVVVFGRDYLFASGSTWPVRVLVGLVLGLLFQVFLSVLYETFRPRFDKWLPPHGRRSGLGNPEVLTAITLAAAVWTVSVFYGKAKLRSVKNCLEDYGVERQQTEVTFETAVDVCMGEYSDL